MRTVNLDDCYGNIITIDFLFTNGYPTTVNWVSMQSEDKKTIADLEITKWEGFYEVNTFVVPELTDYDEYFDTEQELQDWVRSLSYKYKMRLMRNS